MRATPVLLAAACLALVWPCLSWAEGGALLVPSVRIKDIATVVGSRGQELMGYGLVIGLDGSGDSSRSVFTAQALANLLENFDLKVLPADLTTKNIAAVMATAQLPASAREGDTLDITIASVGDAKNLYGGILLPTPMRGNSNDVYALAQGSVSIGGSGAASGGESAQKNHPVTARVIDGGSVTQGVPPALDAERIVFSLRQPDFTTAVHISEAINKHVEGQWAQAVAAESVEVKLPLNRMGDIIGLISELEGLSVTSDTAARVVVNERTGTIIIGGDVRLLPCAVAHGNLTITVSQDWDVSQPPPFSAGDVVLRSGEAPGDGRGTAKPVPPVGAAGGGAAPTPIVPTLPGGRTVVTPKTKLDVSEDSASLMPLGGTTSLKQLVDALNALGVKPRDLIAVLQALKAANALQAELVLM